jgi:hypothetical protein
MDHGRCRTHSSQSRSAKTEGALGNGQRTTDNGQRRTDAGQRTESKALPTTDHGQKGTYAGQWTKSAPARKVVAGESVHAEPPRAHGANRDKHLYGLHNVVKPPHFLACCLFVCWRLRVRYDQYSIGFREQFRFGVSRKILPATCAGGGMDFNRIKRAEWTTSKLPDAVPACVLDEGSLRFVFSGLNHTAFDIAVYASQDGSPHHNARLASRLLRKFYRTGLVTRRVPIRGFTSEMILLFRVAWRHDTIPNSHASLTGRAYRQGPDWPTCAGPNG